MGIKLKNIKKGFTLIETIIALAVVSIVLPVLISMLVMSFRVNLDYLELKKIKNNGDYTINTILSVLRKEVDSIVDCSDNTVNLCSNLEDVYPTSGTANEICFLDKNKELIKVSLVSLGSGENLVSYIKLEEDGNTINLTSSSEAKINNFSVSCQGSALSPPVFQIKFDVVSMLNNKFSLNYISKTKLRNY